MMSTALAGAYMIGFGVDRLAFPKDNHNLNPLVLMSGGGCKDPACYGVMAGVIVLALVGYAVQLSRSNKEESHTRFSRVLVEEEYVPAAYIQYDGQALTGVERRVSRENVIV